MYLLNCISVNKWRSVQTDVYLFYLEIFTFVEKCSKEKSQIKKKEEIPVKMMKQNNDISGEEIL